MTMDTTTAVVILGCALLFSAIAVVALFLTGYLRGGGRVGASSFFFEAGDRRPERRKSPGTRLNPPADMDTRPEVSRPLQAEATGSES